MSAGSPAVELADYAWLIGSDGTAWLSRAASDASPLTQLMPRLRRELSAARAHLVVEQLDLRRRARDKFARANELFFTRRQLEQASDDCVARHKAGRFARGAALADLCCGIGGDLLALAERGPVMAVDRDPVALLLAEANARACRTIESDDALSFHGGEVNAAVLAGAAAWHIDPDRRPAGQRTTRVELHDPPAETLQQLLAACPHAAIKLAPAAMLPAHWSNRSELEWISRAGSCRQLVAWFGNLVDAPGNRRATIVARDQPAISLVGSTASSPASSVPPASAVGRYVLEPDAAVIAAGLVDELARRIHAAPLDRRIAYLTRDALVNDAPEARFVAQFEVLESLPFQQRRVKALLRERGLGQLEIKLRGVPYSVDELRHRLRVPGDAAATLLIFRQDDKPIAVVARRLS